MLLRRVARLPEGPNWHFEVKWDGYRMQATKQGAVVRLISRNGANFTRRFSQVAKAVSGLNPGILHMDGELVAMDRQGRPSFQVLQAGLPLPEGWRFGYYAFDLLHQGRRSLTASPLAERRSKLEEVVTGSAVRFSPSLAGTSDQILQAVREQKLEGVVAKRADSVYEAGKRGGAWVKLPCKQGGKFLVGGYRPDGKSFSVLLVGKSDGTRFQFAGKVRHGFDAASRQRVFEAVKPLRSAKCPFANLPNCKADPFDENVMSEEMASFVWLRPEVELVVYYVEWTRMGSLRHPELRGFRLDRQPVAQP